jgi:hypothetical protein
MTSRPILESGRSLSAAAKWTTLMLHFAQQNLGERIRDADKADAALVADIIGAACRRFPSLGQGEKTARVDRLIRSGAWTDAALALIDLELPLWHVRRLAYDQGEWHCALSRECELPDWLDQAIETRHADLALAILGAFVEAQRASQGESRPSVPVVNRTAPDVYEPLCSDNFS